MHCEECREQMLELIYEEGIRPRRRLELLDHVDGCPLCHEQYTALLESRALLQEWPDEEPAWGLRVNPDYRVPAVRRWLAPFRGVGFSWPVFKGALVVLLALVALLAISQSQFSWKNGGLTVHAQLWKGGNSGPETLSSQELLTLVDRMLAESEQRQNKLFGTALIKMWEDLEIRKRYEYGEIQTAFEGLQKQNEARWERSVKTSQ
ncbi:MAG: hypothetical protein HY315_01715 [Acidobacteria bacterium]|nr:hypothetical protein [Acidobacteriota bacterium]